MLFIHCRYLRSLSKYASASEACPYTSRTTTSRLETRSGKEARGAERRTSRKIGTRLVRECGHLRLGECGHSAELLPAGSWAKWTMGSRVWRGRHVDVERMRCCKLSLLNFAALLPVACGYAVRLLETHQSHKLPAAPARSTTYHFLPCKTHWIYAID
jgi:hypothetical protein